jgi:demethylmenaquinone methyltransferase/2-methoxy-6-polyprenyl-1,4-benzoquinol methylase
MFSRLVPGYDAFNFWSSLGMDEGWRREAVRPLSRGWKVLDLGAGTGALTRLAAAQVGFPATPHAGVVGLDFSHEMLLRARRLSEGPWSGKGAKPPDWVAGGAERLPFRSGTFDAVVSAFVLRNLHQGGVMSAALRECLRVLKPGGRLIVLDLKRPERRWLAWGHSIYTRTLVPLLGRLFFGRCWPGVYLTRSIDDLPTAPRLLEALESSGFASPRLTSLAGGVVGILQGVKPC